MGVETKVYVINLEARDDRRRSVTRQLDGTGIDYEFFRAVEGPGALEEYFQGRSDWACHMEIERKGLPSEVACHASHLSLWKRCVESGESMVILEDDFAATSVIRAAVEFAVKHIDRFGFIRLEPMEGKWRLDKGYKPEPVLQSEPFTIYFQATVSLRTTGYAINPVVAQRFIDVSRKFTVPVDHLFRRQWVHRMPLFAIDPPAIDLADLADDPSIVGRKKSPLRHFLRQAKIGYRAWARHATKRTNSALRHDYAYLFEQGA